ncbi:MAG: hypothetical protein K6G15_03170 [Desulfovibrio sp.]|nr:hypothetical protein [Desulfovibrio sp.]
MNTSTQNHLDEMVNMKMPDGVEETLSMEAMNESEDIFAGKNFSSLDGLAMEGRQILETLESRIENLQERFIRLLTTEMQRAGIQLENRLHLSLSDQGDLIVEGEDNDTDKVQEILSHSDLLQKKFRELAYISFLSYGIDMVCQAREAMEDQESEQSSIFSHFHAYIKGTLSHFYIK